MYNQKNFACLYSFFYRISGITYTALLVIVYCEEGYLILLNSSLIYLFFQSKFKRYDIERINSFIFE